TGSVTSMWTEGEWSNYSKTEYQYTPEGETDEYIIYIWENERWESYHRSDCIYDSDNLNYLNYKYMWNAGWQLSSKDDNSFDANGNMIRSITQNYAEGNWTNQSRSENSYTEFTGLIQPLSPLPEEIELYQNYPNPFNPETEISFSLKNETFITLELFNTSGQLIKVLYEGKHSSGDHKIKIDASDLESGTYYYKLENEVSSIIRKMTVIK
ncbi:MAG: T9SS type A sorting domain-containing protein, partial [Candidatus Delongbacteria bacterium]